MLNRFIRRLCLALTATLGLSVGTAQATPFVWFDTFDAGTVVSANSPLSFMHDIRDGGFGFRPGIDTVFTATLNVILTDDALFGDLPIVGDREETVSFNFDGTGWTMPSNVDFLDLFSFQFSSLLNDGLLGVTIRANQGDFKFIASSLVVVGDRAAVPEPVSLALFGVGLLALVGIGARRRSLLTRHSSAA